MLTVRGIIVVCDYSGTHIARWNGKTASCTAGRKRAAEAVAKKVMGDRHYVIKMLGEGYAWQVLTDRTDWNGHIQHA